MKNKWVFWFRISVRKQWFSYWWKTRGSNHMELQIWIFKISIGLPWNKSIQDIDYIEKTNYNNLKAPYTLLIKN